MKDNCIAAIHQPHYFPWLGYFDKLAKADVFVLLDQVQFEKGSQMIRNRIIDTNGVPKYLTISADTDSFLEREYREINVKDSEKWTYKQLAMIENYYRKASAKSEILPFIQEFLSERYATVCQWTCASIKLICQLLDIKTPLIYQSETVYDRNSKKSDLVLAICRALYADTYFSGRGASVNYLDREKFAMNNINIVFQDFTHPVYPQINTAEFIPGVSTLDLLFNCGIEESRRIFWENVHSSHEFCLREQ